MEKSKEEITEWLKEHDREIKDLWKIFRESQLNTQRDISDIKTMVSNTNTKLDGYMDLCKALDEKDDNKDESFTKSKYFYISLMITIILSVLGIVVAVLIKYG